MMGIKMKGNTQQISDTIESHAEARGLSHYLGSCQYLRAMLLQGPCQSEWPELPFGDMVTSGAELKYKDQNNVILKYNVK